MGRRDEAKQRRRLKNSELFASVNAIARADTAERHLRAIAMQACKPKTEASEYPGEFIEFSDIQSHQLSMPTDAPALDRARRILARGIPYQEFGYSETPMKAA